MPAMNTAAGAWNLRKRGFPVAMWCDSLPSVGFNTGEEVAYL